MSDFKPDFPKLTDLVFKVQNYGWRPVVIEVRDAGHGYNKVTDRWDQRVAVWITYAQPSNRDSRYNSIELCQDTAITPTAVDAINKFASQLASQLDIPIRYQALTGPKRARAKTWVELQSPPPKMEWTVHWKVDCWNSDGVKETFMAIDKISASTGNDVHYQTRLLLEERFKAPSRHYHQVKELKSSDVLSGGNGVFYVDDYPKGGLSTLQIRKLALEKEPIEVLKEVFAACPEWSIWNVMRALYESFQVQIEDVEFISRWRLGKSSDSKCRKKMQIVIHKARSNWEPKIRMREAFDAYVPASEFLEKDLGMLALCEVLRSEFGISIRYGKEISHFHCCHPVPDHVDRVFFEGLSESFNEKMREEAKKRQTDTDNK